MAKDILAEDGTAVSVEYPKDDMKFRITYQKGPKEVPAYCYAHTLSTFVYDFIVPSLDFKEEKLALRANCSV